jgi:ribonucleoside-triphosphate reductase
VLLNTSSGIHTRWAPFYIRRTRASVSTPLYRVLKDAGVPMRPENGQTEADANTWVVSWPMRSPEGAKTRKDVSAIEQCEFWLLNKLNWTEHNPSVTITYQPHEVLDLINWVWENRDRIGGMAFLPADDAAYEQAPMEEISEAEYERLMGEFPEIDFSLLYAYEHSDMTTAAQELACLAGACEV